MIAQVFGDANTNFVLLLLILLPAVQWLTGVLRAVANGTLKWELVDTFIRSDLAGRVLPLLILIVTGRVIDVAAPGTLEIPGLDLALLTTGGLAAAIVYLLVVARRIFDNVNPRVPDTLPVPE